MVRYEEIDSRPLLLDTHGGSPVVGSEVGSVVGKNVL